MKQLNNTKRTRFKITTYSLIGLFLALGGAIYKELNDVATACLMSIGAMGSVYGWAETKRKSGEENEI